MASVTDCLVQIQELTRKNLEILKAINDSFFTKQNHLSVNIGDTQYVIPSFVSLENKINYLQDAFNNVVNAPATGEAYFNIDGNSRAIEVRGYTHTPNSLTLDPVLTFGVESNDIFKDFLTPAPYVNFSLSNIPNDITSVNIKKIIPKNLELIAKFEKQLNNSASVNWVFSDLYKILSLYKEDVDYVSYDIVRKLPIRKNIGSGTYVIESIISDVIDKNLDEYITLKLRTDINTYPYRKNLTYQLFDETIEKPLKVGDQLVTYDDSAKMEITEIRSSSNTIVVKVLNGEYLNLIGDNEETIDNINDLAKIKFYSPVDFDEDKYINVPLEEDQYVFIAIAPLNERMNIQSPWGNGVVINTYKLTKGFGGENFKKYYDENVRNIGDTLFEITSMMPNTLNKYSREDFEKFINTQPSIDINNLQVTQINKHLNDSVVVKNIRALYSQKKQYNIELTEVQSKITDINAKLSSISFDDTTDMRAIYTAQLTEYNQKKNELVSSITKIIDEISLSVNNSEIPIENAKYRIRGYFDYESFVNNLGGISKDSINGIKVQYRYKNLDQPQSNAQSFNGKFTFSDWVDMNSFIRPRIPEMDENGNYKFKLAKDNSNENEPSFNQIDIPISQGETVDIRLKIIYDFGYPYIETSSAWSEIVNIAFPQEYLKDVQILDIIEENNNDIETNRFQNILRDNGIPMHIDDKIIDQDITYFHKPENIASGFYTSERRVIPLKDKLSEIDSSLILLKDEILNSSSEALKVDIVVGDVANRLQPYQTNNIVVESYNSIKGNNTTGGVYTYDEQSEIANVVLNIILTNESQHSCKLFSMFPGSRNISLNDLQKGYTKFDLNDYARFGSTYSGEEEGTLVKNFDGEYLNSGEIMEVNSSKLYIKADYFVDSYLTEISNDNDGVTKRYINFYKKNGNFEDNEFPTNISDFTKALGEAGFDLDNDGDYVFNLGNDYNISTNDLGEREYYTYEQIIDIRNSMVYVEKNNRTPYAKYVNKNNNAETKTYFIECDENGNPIKYKENISYRPLGVFFRYSVNEYVVDDGKHINNFIDKRQTPNQFITFRLNNPYNGEDYYSAQIGQRAENDKMYSGGIESFTSNNSDSKVSDGAVLYPYIASEFSLCLDNNTTNSWVNMGPGESIIIPLMFEYKLSGLEIISKTMSFDLRTSLYNDPINYTFMVTAKQNSSIQDKALTTNRKYLNSTKYNTTVVK